MEYRYTDVRILTVVSVSLSEPSLFKVSSPPLLSHLRLRKSINLLMRSSSRDVVWILVCFIGSFSNLPLSELIVTYHLLHALYADFCLYRTSVLCVPH